VSFHCIPCFDLPIALLKGGRLLCDRYKALSGSERNHQFFPAGHSATRILHDAEESSCSKMTHTSSQLTMLFDSRG
jgi:hypothetical protein